MITLHIAPGDLVSVARWRMQNRAIACLRRRLRRCYNVAYHPRARWEALQRMTWLEDCLDGWGLLHAPMVRPYALWPHKPDPDAAYYAGRVKGY